MTDLSQRIADLSPEKRKLLEQLLEKEASSSSGARPVSKERAPVSSEEKEQTRRFYNSINQQLDAAMFGTYSVFLNYGYVSDESRQYSQVELPNHLLNRNSVKLVLEVIGDCEIDQSVLLDVGCGRGGTLDLINRYFNVRQSVGIDLSTSAISFCKQNYEHPRARFLEADAEALPFASGVFDVVTNIESSHRYPNVADFYQEVLRVLKPGGHFLYADLVPAMSVSQRLNYLQEIGFTLEINRDITRNVLLSCDEIAEQRLGAFAEGHDPGLMNEFLSVPGSQVYEELNSGEWTYKIFRLKKHGS
jgi:phthiocerol/phenolphthiocerol synthesis type-I polyketide synthase E